MDDIGKRIEVIKKEIRETPYHKGTEHHIGLLRARLARLRDQVIERQAKKGGGGAGYAIKKHGDATVVLVGFPSVGKSTLLNALTNAKSPTAEYAFTTVSVIPGMMQYRGASIQILDVPGLIEGAASGKGRGREVLSVVRGADLLLIMAEAGKEETFNRMKKELHLNGVRINESPPAVSIKKELRGGLKINSTLRQDLDRETTKDIAKEFGFINGEITIKEKLTLERLIDAFAKNRVYVAAIYVVNKIDQVARVSRVSREWIEISAEKRIGLDKLREALWGKFSLVRVYLRRPDGTTDREEPMIMRQGQILSDVLARVGTEFAETKKGAKIWGSGSRFPGQKVSLSTKVQDEMEVMFMGG